MKSPLSHLSIIAANVMWGLYATICKGFLGSGLIGSWALCGIKMIGGALLFWCASFLLPQSLAPKEHIERRDLLKLFFASMLINAGNQSCIILGLSYTSPVDATVICSMAPIFTVVLATLLLRQRVSMAKTVGVILGFTGAMLFVFPGILWGDGSTLSYGVGNNPLLGNTLIIISQICGALYLLLFTDVLSRYSAVTLIKWLFLFSAIVLAPLTVADIIHSNWAAMDTSTWLQLGYIIVFATGLAYFLLIIGQKHVSPEAIAMYNYMQPITATISSVMAGMAVVTGQQQIAMLLCLSGVYIVIKVK